LASSCPYRAHSFFHKNDGKCSISKQKQLNRARQFVRATLGEIYDQHSPALQRYAYHLRGNADYAKECIAQGFSRFCIYCARAIARAIICALNSTAHRHRPWARRVVHSHRKEKPRFLINRNLGFVLSFDHRERF
jgi:hypothetical protein